MKFLLFVLNLETKILTSMARSLISTGCRVSMLTMIFSLITFSSMMAQTSSTDGETLYLTRCNSCHQADGEGITGVFPPLNEVDWVTGDKGRLIRIILDGVMGEMQVGNTVYSGAMPPWKTFLNDQETAALLSYIRTAWDNNASAVTENEVKLVRKATAGRTQAWTAEELAAKENQGVPGAFSFILAPPDTSGSN